MLGPEHNSIFCLCIYPLWVYIGLMSEKSTQKGAGTSHLDDLPRVNRIVGQVSGVKKMIEEQRGCTDILTQLRAIRSAIKGLEANILERHLGHCLNAGLSAGDQAAVKRQIDELKEVFKRYDE